MGCDFPTEGGPQHFLQTGLLEFLSIFLVLNCQSPQVGVGGSGRGDRVWGVTESSPGMLPPRAVPCRGESWEGRGALSSRIQGS